MDQNSLDLDANQNNDGTSHVKIVNQDALRVPQGNATSARATSARAKSAVDNAMQKIDDDIFDGQITKELKKNNLK